MAFAAQTTYYQTRWAKAAIIGEDHLLAMRNYLLDRVDARPSDYRGLLLDDALAKVLDIGLTCQYVRMEFVPSVFAHDIYHCIVDCTADGTDILVFDLGSWDLEELDVPASEVAFALLNIARNALRLFDFKLIVFI